MKGVLVTGIHRSGTTFVGKMISLHPKIAYIHEPFNPVNGLEKVNTWFKYITKENVEENQHIISEISKLILLNKVRYSILSIDGHKSLTRKKLLNELFDYFTFHNLSRVLLKELFRSKAQLKYNYYRMTKFIKRIPLLKDPVAVLSSNFLANYFGIKVILLVRHPLGFVSSLKRLNWKIDFSSLLGQKDLINKYPDYFRELKKIDIGKHPFHIKAAWFWNTIYYIVKDFVSKNENFIIKTHEEISKNPYESFNELYKKLSLYSEDGYFFVITGGQFMIVIHKNLLNFKKILTTKEQSDILYITNEISKYFYPINPFR